MQGRSSKVDKLNMSGGETLDISAVLGINDLILLFPYRYENTFQLLNTECSQCKKNLRIQIQMLPGLIFHRDTKSKGRAHYYCIIVRAPGFVSILDYLPFRNN